MLEHNGQQHAVNATVVVRRHVTWDFSTIEFHLYKVGHGVLGHKGRMELSVASILYTTRYGAVIDHDLQVS